MSELKCQLFDLLHYLLLFRVTILVKSILLFNILLLKDDFKKSLNASKVYGFIMPYILELNKTVRNNSEFNLVLSNRVSY